MAQPRFIFRLQPLLDHRTNVEKSHMRAVAQIQNQANLIVRQIQDSQRAIQQENRQLTAQHLTGRLDMAYIATEKRFVGSLNLLISQAYQKLAVIEKQLLAAKALLLAASRARKVIEKLREKQHARWLLDLNRKEAAFMDEIGTQLALRQASALDLDHKINTDHT